MFSAALLRYSPVLFTEKFFYKPLFEICNKTMRMRSNEDTPFNKINNYY